MPKRLFSATPVEQRFGEGTARFTTDILGQGQGAAARSIFLETVVLLDDFHVIFVPEHSRHFAGQTEQ
ncbi:MAG: hypothetical protein A2Z25_05445 [Planctomycetes bacterium RBG_16_55_9]|nr:MAG: hypothetical protein A2Z25_05445 [Planctomycetes bacterium RBG_16_55_9]